MQYAEFLKPNEVAQIHEAAIEILDTVGILVRNEKARNIFKKHGCNVDAETYIVKIPPNVIRTFRQAFVPSFQFRGRDPQFDRTIPEDRPLIVTASSAPNINDPQSGQERPANSRDIANIAHLINELPGYDVFSISTLASDAPETLFSISRFYPALKNCLKPIRGNTPNMNDLRQVLELGTLIAGSREAYFERPLITHHCCPVVSPLTLDVESTEILMYLVENELPVYGTIVPNAGMTAPMSLTGTLALGNAEFLSMGVLMQMIRPQTPLIYAVLSTVADLRSGEYAPGGIETGILQMAHAEMARFYGVPSGGYVGLTNSHIDDVQSGYETGMSATAAMLGGADMFNMGGLLGSLMTFDYAKAIIDNEIALMLKRINRGMEPINESSSLDLIKEVGPGGNYMVQEDTVKRMRSTALLPALAIREMHASWEEHGRRDVYSKAMQQVKEILTQDNPAVFGKEIDQKIRSRFKDLVPGNTGFNND
jgi:trimethylamine--corrinoid protein Co-methyltransferase